MDSQPRVERATKADVGRLFSGSKVRYEWLVRVNGALVSFVFKDSKSSKRKWLSVNGQMFLDEVAKEPGFEVRVILEPHTFCIFPDKGQYRLRINNVVDNTGMVVVKAPEEPESFVNDPLKFRKEVDGSFRVSVNSTENTPRPNPPTVLQDALLQRRDSRSNGNGLTSPMRPSSNRALATPQSPNASGSLRGIVAPKFDALNDSAEFYSHSDPFMSIKEPLENANLVKAINRLA